jgi:hypothetical protein
MTNEAEASKARETTQHGSLPGWLEENDSRWPGIVKLFPARESLVIDMPAGNRKIANLFFTVYIVSKLAHNRCLQ